MPRKPIEYGTRLIKHNRKYALKKKSQIIIRILLLKKKNIFVLNVQHIKSRFCAKTSIFLSNTRVVKIILKVV